MWWDGMLWRNVMWLDGMGWDRMWWDRMGCDGMGWNGIGWNVLWCNLTSIEVSCLQYILEINSKLGHQHTRWSGEFCFVAVLARFKKWKTWLTSPYFPRSARFLLVVILTGLFSTFSTKKNRGYLSHQDSSPGKEVRYQEVKQKGSSQSSRLLFLFCLFLFQFFLWAHCMEWENRERKQLQADCKWSESRNLESSWLLDKNSFILGRVATSRDRLLSSI